MAIPFWKGLATAALLLAEPAMGHMAMVTPTSRSTSNSKFNRENRNNLAFFDGAPWAYSSGGVTRVTARARENINPATFKEYGNGQYPLLFTPFADNGNMLEPQEVSKRHFVCGDPRFFPQGGGDSVIPYSTKNRAWETLTTYTKGQIIEIDLHVRFYHKGHVEFSICDTSDQPYWATANQACFNKYPLTRAADDDHNSPIDPNYPGRYFVAPPCTASETGQGINENVDYDNGDSYKPYNVKMRYQLPDIACEHCVLQMHYFTAHRCNHIGYAEFNPPSWPSRCAPNKSSWMAYNHREPEAICGMPTTTYHSVNYPEEFWGCSDIEIKDPCVAYGGIHQSNPGGLDTCCASYCGVCNGTDCKARGRNNCCPWRIGAVAAPCSATNPAPCVLDPCAEFNGIYNYAADGDDTCCANYCGVCNGTDCSSRGRNNCCPWRIRSKAAPCSATNSAPCKLAT